MTVVHYLEREVRLIDEHIRTAEVMRIPAPALHVRNNDLDLLVVSGAAELPDCSSIETAGRR
jgi:hypothetical protein